MYSAALILHIQTLASIVRVHQIFISKSWLLTSVLQKSNSTLKWLNVTSGQYCNRWQGAYHQLSSLSTAAKLTINKHSRTQSSRRSFGLGWHSNAKKHRSMLTKDFFFLTKTKYSMNIPPFI